MSAGPNKLQVPVAICVGLIAVAWAVAVINVVVNVRNGSRLSVDDSGMWLNGAVVGALSLGPALLASTSGYLWSGKRWGWATFAGLLAIPLVAFNLWNSSEFVGDQMLGRIKQHEDRVTAGKDIAEIQNQEALRSKREAEERLWRTYLTTKDPKEQARIKSELAEIRGVPLALTAPSFDSASAIGARSSWVAKRMGWDREIVEGITPLMVPILMQVVELFFSLLGFGLWPHPKQPEFPETFLKLTRAEAKTHLLEMQQQGKHLGVTEFARIWGVPGGTASRWVTEFAREGLTRQVQRGRRKVSVAPPHLVNGKLHGVS